MVSVAISAVICLEKEIFIKIKGMHCNSCAKIIQEKLLKLDGVKEAKVSYLDENAEIKFEPEKTSLNKIEEALNEVGYRIKKEPSNKGNVSIGIIGMESEENEKEVRETLLKLEGVKNVKIDFEEKNAEIDFDSEKVSLDHIEEELIELDYEIKEPKREEKNSGKKESVLKQGIIYGLVPHIGCIGFIAASILGATIAVEFFKPFLMNPWFFHILVLISIGFATISSIFYLRKQGLLSRLGVLRKKKYLATMYGITVGINLILFLLVFPMLANLDTGSFAENAGTVGLAGDSGQLAAGNSLIRLQVDIPCPGHAPLISGELKTIEGITGVRFDFPNYFDVAYDSEQTSKEEMLALEVFEIYKPSVISESDAIDSGSASLQGIKEVEAAPADSGGSCGGSCGGSSCGGSTGGSCGCGG